MVFSHKAGNALIFYFVSRRIAFPCVLVFSKNFPNNATSRDELYHQPAEGCLFYTCRVLWLQLREHSPAFASLPGISIVQHCLRKPNVAKIWPENQQHCWSKLEAGSKPRSTACGGETALSQCFWAPWHWLGAPAGLRPFPWNAFAPGWVFLP